jgi:hypothetical protein
VRLASFALVQLAVPATQRHQLLQPAVDVEKLRGPAYDELAGLVRVCLLEVLLVMEVLVAPVSAVSAAAAALWRVTTLLFAGALLLLWEPFAAGLRLQIRILR